MCCALASSAPSVPGNAFPSSSSYTGFIRSENKSCGLGLNSRLNGFCAAADAMFRSPSRFIRSKNKSCGPGLNSRLNGFCAAADAKKEAEVAKEREVALWQEALKTGEQVHPLTEETLNKHMQGPIIIEDERNAQNVSHLPSPIQCDCRQLVACSLLHARSYLHQ